MNQRLPHPILAIAAARLREFVRRPETIFWVYFFPVLMVAILGVAFRNQKPEQFDIDIIQGEHDHRLRTILETYDRIRVQIVPEKQAVKRMRTGRTSLLIGGDEVDSAGIDSQLLDSSFNSALQLPLVRYTFDPTRPASVSARNLVDDYLQRSAGRMDLVESKDIVFDQPGGRYVDFLVPGLLGMSLMGGGLWGIGYAIVDMRIRKLLKRLMATPMRRIDFLLGMLISRLVFMVPQIAILLLFSYWLFDVRVYGNWFSLLLVIFLGAVQFSVIGLLVASRAQTMETVSGLMNLVMLPMYTLCGIFFSYQNFPALMHPFIKWLPLTPLIDALRGIMLDGAAIGSLAPELLRISLWCVIPFIVALKIFRWND